MSGKQLYSSFAIFLLIASTACRGESDRATVTLKSSEIDLMIEKTLKAADVEVSPLCNDEDFLRRAYLDLTGQPPLPHQLIEFVEDAAVDKRARVIDQLLRTEAYARNWARYWRDVIAYRAIDQRYRVFASRFEQWLAEQLKENRKWDDIATELITAKGRADESGTTFLIMAQSDQQNTAVNLAAEVSRVFMGIQIQCAQCHDHPYDEWKRLQFHEMAAFFNRTRVRRIRQDSGPPIFEVVSLDGSNSRLRGFLNRRGVSLEYRMPDLEDPSKTTEVHPKFLLGQAPAEKLSDSVRRGMFARYLTDESNPWFARSFVNRIWCELMGEGFYAPVDDLGPGKDARFPMVSNRLASAFRQSQYDVRWLLSTVMNTNAYQRELRPKDPTGSGPLFAAACNRRLRSDQILDSLTRALAIPQQRAFAGRSRAMGPYGRGGVRAAFGQTFGVDPSTPFEEVQGTIPQSLFLMNNPITDLYTSAIGNTLLGRLLPVYEDDQELIGLLYRRVLAREPSEKDLKTCLDYIAEVNNRAEAFEDILWGLINSTEFISKR